MWFFCVLPTVVCVVSPQLISFYLWICVSWLLPANKRAPVPDPLINSPALCNIRGLTHISSLIQFSTRLLSTFSSFRIQVLFLEPCYLLLLCASVPFSLVRLVLCVTWHSCDPAFSLKPNFPSLYNKPSSMSLFIYIVIYNINSICVGSQ